MPNSKTNPQMVIVKHISKILIGEQLVNLGEVLEMNHKKNIVSIVIFRMNEKQVFTFSKQQVLLIHID